MSPLKRLKTDPGSKRHQPVYQGRILVRAPPTPENPNSAAVASTRAGEEESLVIKARSDIRLVDFPSTAPGDETCSPPALCIINKSRKRSPRDAEDYLSNTIGL